MTRRSILTVVVAVLGLALSAALAWSASQLAGQRIGLASEPLAVTQGLAPHQRAAAPPKPVHTGDEKASTKPTPPPRPAVTPTSPQTFTTSTSAPSPVTPAAPVPAPAAPTTAAPAVRTTTASSSTASSAQSSSGAARRRDDHHPDD